jgi:hypothetical protein
MQDSEKIYLSLSLESSLSSLEASASKLLEGETIPTFGEFVVDFDAELAGNAGMMWLRVGLFKIYNMYFHLDIDDFTNSYSPPDNDDDNERGRRRIRSRSRSRRSESRKEVTA